MAHYAKIENNIVTNVIVAEQDFIDTLEDKELWVQTSYNTRGGVHYLPDSNTPSGQPHLRYNYAGIGFTYDEERDAFIPPKTYDSWILNEETCLWEAPISYPQDDKHYVWDENILNWKEVIYD